MNYQIQEKDKTKYISLVLLNQIINFQTYYPVNLEREDIFLENYLKFMYSKGVLDIDQGSYVPTELGRTELINLFNKYYEYLKIYDIFCAVDLEKGEFAFSSINDFESDEEWLDFLHDDRFSDVRVAVSDFKGIDPVEIVFLSFLNEGRFETNGRWQYNLTGDSIWREIEEICNSAVSREYLESEGVIEDVIKQGSEIALELISVALEEQEEQSEEIIEETTTETTYVDIVEEPYYDYDYYEPYYDPFYISPIWIVPCVLLF